MKPNKCCKKHRNMVHKMNINVHPYSVNAHIRWDHRPCVGLEIVYEKEGVIDSTSCWAPIRHNQSYHPWMIDEFCIQPKELQLSPSDSSIGYGLRLMKRKSLIRIPSPPSLVWTCWKEKRKKSYNLHGPHTQCLFQTYTFWTIHNIHLNYPILIH